MSSTFDSKQLERLKTISWKGESQIPVPPQSVVEFSALARKPDVKISELCDVVDCEPALTTELLRNVNSCVHGLRHKIESVSQAIALLGIPSSTTILLTSALSTSVRNVESPLIPSADFRRETVERAIFARDTAKRMGIDTTLTYTAAMLQDILLPLLTRQHPTEYSTYLANPQCSSIADFELETFGWTHAELAAKTLLNWGFPESLALCVLQHHESAERLLVDHAHVPIEFPGAAAALLMDVLRQSPDGVTRLIDLGSIDPRFNLMELAHAVDEQTENMSGAFQHSISLQRRLQQSMLSQLELRRGNSVTSGRQFGNYVLEEKLKESSMGAVFKARHIRLKRPAAVKILRADRTTRESIRQFEQEVQLTCSLRHPNTVSIFDYGHTPDDLFYYAMELVEGLTLSELVRLQGRLSDGRVLFLLRQVCCSLAEAHGHDLIHRDIKPENIMVSHRFGHPDHVTVLDFGLVKSAKPENDPNSNSRSVVGTPLYMSPETVSGHELIDQRSDLYSVGAVGYFLLTGRPVFEGDSFSEVLRHHIETTPTPPSVHCRDPISQKLEQLLLSCLNKDPSQRPQSAVQLAAKLAECEPLTPWSEAEAANWWLASSCMAGIGDDNDSLMDEDLRSQTLVVT